MMSLHDFIDGPYCWDCGYARSSVEGSYACSGVEGVLGPRIGAHRHARVNLARRILRGEDGR